MTIGGICNREVVYAARDTTVYGGAQLMRHRHVGTFVMVDEFSGKRVPVGFVTTVSGELSDIANIIVREQAHEARTRR
ncbi:MAG TPA: hypothetical protein VFP00_05285 [Burkholderiales bacterium]|nr:hypothetical protein [Burkholderiales bacterium]